jgi:hypothetical protein
LTDSCAALRPEWRSPSRWRGWVRGLSSPPCRGGPLVTTPRDRATPPKLGGDSPRNSPPQMRRGVRRLTDGVVLNMKCRNSSRRAWPCACVVARLLFNGPRLFPPLATVDCGACITVRLVSRLPAQMRTLKSAGRKAHDTEGVSWLATRGWRSHRCVCLRPRAGTNLRRGRILEEQKTGT